MNTLQKQIGAACNRMARSAAYTVLEDCTIQRDLNEIAPDAASAVLNDASVKRDMNTAARDAVDAVLNDSRIYEDYRDFFQRILQDPELIKDVALFLCRVIVVSAIQLKGIIQTESLKQSTSILSGFCKVIKRNVHLITMLLFVFAVCAILTGWSRWLLVMVFVAAMSTPRKTKHYFVFPGRSLHSANEVPREICTGHVVRVLSMVYHRHRDTSVSNDAFHPRNLLEPGTKSWYDSAGSGPPEEDWIVFRQTEQRMIPIMIGLRNSEGDWGLKSIFIDVSTDSDGKCFQKWIQINDIHRGQNKMQKFAVVPLKSHLAWTTGFNYFRLHLLENHGGSFNQFYEFVIYGIVDS